MTDIKLITPTSLWANEILAYRSEFIKTTEVISGSSSLNQFSQAEAWLTHLTLNQKQATLPNKNFVPSYQYLLVDLKADKILGMANLRLTLNDYLLNFGGHIGYSIAPSARGQGYGKIILAETLKAAASFQIEKALLTCDDDNLASAQIIEANGGQLENKYYEEEINKWVRRYWINLSR